MAKGRIKHELREICYGRWGEQLVAMSVPDSSDLSHLKLIVISPSDAPTADYIFTLDVNLPHEYPFTPPKILFDNRLWYPRVSAIGNVCLLQLTQEWKPAISFSTLGLAFEDILRDPGDISGDGRVLNLEAHDEIKTDRHVYKRHALEWAEKDNSGYGMVKFEDLRLAAIQSCLLVPDLIPYECHFYCRSYTSERVELVAVVLPQLTIYQERVEHEYSAMKRITVSPLFHVNEKRVAIKFNQFTRDECWEVNVSGNVFEKAVIDRFDPRKHDFPPRCIVTLTWQRPERSPHGFTEVCKVVTLKDDSQQVIRSFHINVDPTSMTTSARRNRRQTGSNPTFPLLLNLPLSSGEKVNIMQCIGAKYYDFGVLLLHDERGERVDALMCLERRTEYILINIFREWLQGRGKEVSWDVLVEVLEAINCPVAANIRASGYTQSSESSQPPNSRDINDDNMASNEDTNISQGYSISSFIEQYCCIS